MRVSEAFIELLTSLAVAGDETPASAAAGDRADDLLAVFIHNPEVAARTMLALASFIVYGWSEHASKVDQHRAAATLATPPDRGNPVPYFTDFLHAMIDAYEAGEKLNEPAIQLAGKITHNPTDTSLVLWVLSVYLVNAAPKDPEGRKQLIENLVASSVRQQFLFDVELKVPPADGA